MTRARVTRGVLHHRFRDKTDLFGAVMQTVAGELAQRLIARQLSRGTWRGRRMGPAAISRRRYG